MTHYWTTAKGERIEYKDLEDSHLKNIIKDGYRNPHILLEANKRGFNIPKRAIESLSGMELVMMIESLASTALSGNKLSKKMMDYYENDKASFYFYLNQLLERNKSKN